MIKSPAIKKLGNFLLILLVVFSLSAVIYFGGVSILKTLYPRRYIEFVEKYSLSNNLSEEFVFAVIECESGFDKDAVSYLDARGLMQIMPETFTWLQEKRGESLPDESIFEPETAIDYGCYFYGMLMRQFENEATAVAAYHAGAAQVEKWLSDSNYSDDGKTLKDIPYPSTKKYVEKVMRVKNIYEKLYDK
ncbi:MAG: lytic transglycosylase domain-containing protein [Ruminococcaceae bacterium]|nr:lytic transglycosylase domain-containing protein [Oscillospiraceae bacterium]